VEFLVRSFSILSRSCFLRISRQALRANIIRDEGVPSQDHINNSTYLQEEELIDNGMCLDYDVDYDFEDLTVDCLQREEEYFDLVSQKALAFNFRRPSKHRKHSRLNPDRYISAREKARNELPPMRESAFRVLYCPPVQRSSPEPVSASASASAPSRKIPKTSSVRAPQAQVVDEEREIQKSIQASRSEKHASGLTFGQIEELMSRELTPEDYEMLLKLDSLVKPKTVEKSAIDSFLETTWAEKDSNTTCAVCMCSFETDQKVKHLPCEHFFHSLCIVPWLEGHSQNCPLCNAKVL